MHTICAANRMCTLIFSYIFSIHSSLKVLSAAEAHGQWQSAVQIKGSGQSLRAVLEELKVGSATCESQPAGFL